MQKFEKESILIRISNHRVVLDEIKLTRIYSKL